MKNFSLSLFALSLLLAAGCGKEELKAPGTYVGENARLMKDLSRREVFLKVNGEKFTKADFEAAENFQDKLRRMCAGDPLTGPNEPAEHTRLVTRPRTVSEMLRRALLRQFAKANGIVATDEAKAEYAKSLLKTLRRPGKSIDEVAEEFGAEGKIFLAYFEDDARMQAEREFVDTEHTLDIGDDDILAVSNRIARFQANAEEKNAVARADLEKALAELTAGGDFTVVAGKYSSELDEASFWMDGEYLDSFEDTPELMLWLKTAKTGDISPILELDDGYAIVKVVEKRIEDMPPEGIVIPKDIYTLVRIKKEIYDGPEDMTRDEIIEGLKKFRSEALQKKVGDTVMADAVIEWPCGTNLFERVEAKKK